MFGGYGGLEEPFVGKWAVATGLVTRWQLQHDFERVAPGVYVPHGVRLDAVGRAKVAGQWAKGEGVLVGYSAAALLGAKWIDPELPAEIALPTCRHAPPGIRAVQSRIADDECCDRDGFTVSTPVRTAFDLGRCLPRDKAVPVLDSLCRATGLYPNDVLTFAERYPGVRGVRRLRTLIPLVDAGAESPQESLTRLLIIDDGLPPPTTQIVIRDSYGTLIARVDMGWEEWRIAVEYDGIQHWSDSRQRTKDIDRYAVLQELGWLPIRANANLLHHRPHILLDRIRSALFSRGAPIRKPWAR
ncbi:hypothetical protein IU452_18490 [Nocardia transvalensis]|nr:hypothetical protein [Nocardia transvalensis]